MGVGLAGAALRHPVAALGIGAAGYGLATAGNAGLSTAEMAGIATAHGVPSTGFMPGMGGAGRQDARMMFMDSTHGLVQGLHTGRHR
jgi:hypothetical protein